MHHDHVAPIGHGLGPSVETLNEGNVSEESVSENKHVHGSESAPRGLHCRLCIAGECGDVDIHDIESVEAPARRNTPEGLWRY